jgi:hypothetical protein
MDGGWDGVERANSGDMAADTRATRSPLDPLLDHPFRRFIIPEPGGGRLVRCSSYMVVYRSARPMA